MNTRAHVRVGAAATAAFLVLLALTLIERPDVAPAASPAATSTPIPQHQQEQPPDFGGRGGRRFRGGGGPPGGGVPGGGGGFAPAPQQAPDTDGGLS